MKLLAGTHYDPGTAATKNTSGLLAMTALDTTNLRLTFTVPSNGSVLVRMRGVLTGSTTSPTILFGILDHTNSDAVKARQSPIMGKGGSSASCQSALSSSIIVTGLTPGASLTYDAAYGVEHQQGSSVLKWGGPDDASTGTTGGGFAYEIYDTPGLLASAHYDPSTAASLTAAAAAAMTALDTTNLRLTFTAPSSGNVLVRLRGVVYGMTTSTLSTYWGVLDGSTIRFRQRGVGGYSNVTTPLATDHQPCEAAGLVTGLTPGTSYTWDAAYTIDQTQTNAVVTWGGPNNTTIDDAWGGFSFDIWNVDSLPRAIGSVA